jgi:TPP-dependent 2-oxoacid decarboxylase
MSITLTEYLLTRLKELGIREIFGVPGDYNLTLLDYITHDKQLHWIGNCNELNAAYAADGYAHSNTIATLVTTFGVGELSAINGIAGSYAEHIPIVNIVGMPAIALQRKNLFLHHNLSPNNFSNFMQMHIPVTAAQVMLTAQNPGMEIDKLLTLCWQEKRPVYIGVPADMVAFQIEAPTQPLDLSLPKSDLKALQEAVEQVANKLQSTKNPVLILDAYSARHQLLPLIEIFIDTTQIPFVTTPMGKSLIHEAHPNFLGLYVGKYSDDNVRQRVESSDCVLTFGWIRSDINTGSFTSIGKENYAIDIEKDNVRCDHAHYPNVYMYDFIPALLKKLAGYQIKSESIMRKIKTTYNASNNALHLDRFWQRMETFMQENDIILAEVGTSFFGLLGSTLPNNTQIIGQVIWGSIGYTLPALLGSMIAAKDRRHVLFIGDGSLQVTMQELSTLIHHKLCPIIFLINNDGYTIERVIHGEKEIYNDIQRWDYAKLPHMFGDAVWSTKVKTENELEAALFSVANHKDQLVFIEIDTERMDAPMLLKRLLG